MRWLRPKSPWMIFLGSFPHTGDHHTTSVTTNALQTWLISDTTQWVWDPRAPGEGWSETNQTSYDIDPLDWKHNVTYSKENFLDAITSRNSSESCWLSLSHDLHKATVHELTQFMIDHARDQGFKLVRVGECLDDPEENWYRKRSTGGRGFLRNSTKRILRVAEDGSIESYQHLLV